MPRLPIAHCCLALTLAVGCSPESTVRVPAPAAEPSALRKTYSGPADWPCLYGPTGDCVSGERGYLLDSRGTFEKTWSKAIGLGYSAPVVIRDRIVVLHRIDDKERITCMKAASGKLLWEAAEATDFECEYPTYSDGPYSTPVLDETRVYSQSAAGNLRAHSLRDGRLLWERQLSDEFETARLGYGVSHSPLLTNGRLIINVSGTKGESAVVALQPETGETIWQSVKLDVYPARATCTTPVAAKIHGKDWLFCVTADSVVCLASKSGRLVWRIPFGTHSRDTPNSTTPIVVNDLLLVSVFRAGAFCLRIAPDGSYTEVWRSRRSIESCYNPLTCLDGFVYGWHSFDRTLRCVELATGHVRWKKRSVFERGNQIAVDGHFVILGENGHMGWIKATPEKFDLVYVTNEPVIDRPCYTMPVLSGGRLFIRNEKNLVCLTLPVASATASSDDKH